MLLRMFSIPHKLATMFALMPPGPVLNWEEQPGTERAGCEKEETGDHMELRERFLP